jgi:glycosyltransferase involved in cell wall biosynthesis
MKREKTLSLVYYLTLALIVSLLGHQVYLYTREPPAESIHTTQVERIRGTLAGRYAFTFAVVGNINNSLRVFRDQIVPVLNASEPAFLVSSGNAVASGNEENYRALHKALQRLNVAYLLTYGRNEDSDFGAFRFYQYYGPHFYSFVSGNSHFLFIDDTGKTPMDWQLHWLTRELSASSATHRFIFAGLPLHPALPDSSPFEKDNYYDRSDQREALHRVFVEYGVDAVFSANLSRFVDQTHDGVRYVTTGGAGGAIINTEDSFHHYVAVSVEGDDMRIDSVPLDVGVPTWRRTLDSVWAAVYAFFYVSYLRFILLVCLLLAAALKLRSLLYAGGDYYPPYDIDTTVYRERSLRVLLVSNNYYPYISGISVSIDRLARGLRQLRHSALLVVPRYGIETDNSSDTVRVRSLVRLGSRGEFPLANLLQRGLLRACRDFQPDVVHVHHPFWLGSFGLWCARRLQVPVIYTYHTRIEHYAHYIPLPGRLFRNLVSHALVERFANRCDGVIVPTHSAGEYLRTIGVRTHMLVQPTGVNVRAFVEADQGAVNGWREAHATDGRLLLVCVCRLGREKNLNFMLEALAWLKQQKAPAFRLLLVGDGPERAHLEARAQALELGDDLRFAGSVAPEDIPAIYGAADIFVFSSVSETQGMVILEAMSAGLPCVAVRSSGIDDIVEEARTGFKTRENRQEWAEKLRLLLQDAGLRQRMGEAAREVARAHDIAEYAGNIAAFYADTLALYEHRNGAHER